MLRIQLVWLPLCACAMLFPANLAAAQFSGGQLSADVSDDRHAIDDVFSQRVATFNARDLKGQLALFTNDATYYSSTGKLSVRGQEDIGLLFLAAWNGPMQDTTLSEDIVRVQFLSDDGLPADDTGESTAKVAVVEFKIAFHAPADSELSYSELRGVRVLVKREDRWLIHTSCQTPYDEDATLTPERFAEIKENYRAEYNRQINRDGDRPRQ